MGIDYTAGVLFGTFPKAGTDAAQKLAELFSDEGDAFEVPGSPEVTVQHHGNLSDSWYALEFGDRHSLSSRRGGYSGPFQMVEGRGSEFVEEAIRNLGLKKEEFEPIGFFVFMDVW